MTAFIRCLPISTWKLRTLNTNQMRIDKETATFEQQPEIWNQHPRGDYQHQLEWGPIWKSFTKMSKVNLFCINFWCCRSGNWRFSIKITLGVKKSTTIWTHRIYCRIGDWWNFVPINWCGGKCKIRCCLGIDWDRQTKSVCDQNIFPRWSKPLLFHNQALHTRDWKGQF